MDSDPLLLQLVLLLVLIMFSGIFSCVEIAILSVQTVRLEKLSAGGNRKAARLIKLTKKPAKFLAVVQTGSILAGFLASAFAAESFSHRVTAAFINAGFRLPSDLIASASVVLITLVLSFFSIVLGELVPKRIALHKAEQLALFFSGFVLVASFIFAPIVWLLAKSTNALLRLIGIKSEAENKAITEEDICLLVDAGSERGSIEQGEKEIIHNVFEFNDKTAQTVMTHRREAVVLWLKDDDHIWEKTILEKRHSFYPVCADTIDDIRGVLNARNYLALKDRSRDQAMEHAVQSAWFIPGTVGTHVLFRKMRSRRCHFALALDEYGSFDGIITMNDLLEELVGELSGEGAEIKAIEKKGQGLWIIHGGTNLSIVAREIGIVFDTAEKNYDTFGGFVFTLLGRVPDNDEQCEVRYPVKGGEYKITITEVKDHRLETALVELVKS